MFSLNAILLFTHENCKSRDFFAQQIAKKITEKYNASALYTYIRFRNLLQFIQGSFIDLFEIHYTKESSNNRYSYILIPSLS